MSDEDEEIREIIKVTLTPKNKALEHESDVIEEEMNTPIIPVIVITDHSDYSIKGFYDVVECEVNYDNSFVEEKSVRLVVGNEFETNPNDLMPESFVSYVSSCYGLIGQIQELSQSRPSAEIWIHQFDKELEDIIKAAERFKEEERKAKQKAEDLRIRIEKRKMDKNRPLLNPVPSTEPFCRSCHDKVCIMPLVQLKRKLAKYKQKIQRKDEPSENDVFKEEEGLKQICLSTLGAVKLMNMLYKKYLKVNIFKKRLFHNLHKAMMLINLLIYF
jgi:hypothetical protein